MSTATIYGGGFGLYGYISALKAAGFKNFIVSTRHKNWMVGVGMHRSSVAWSMATINHDDAGLSFTQYSVDK